MTLIWILSACFASLTLSLLTSFWLAKKIPQSALNLMVAFSAGTMLSAALLDVLPEALESGQADVHWLLAALLVGLLGFYFLERGAIWRHQHVHGIPTLMRHWSSPPKHLGSGTVCITLLMAC